MLKWLHHLFNPHCPDCKEQLREDKYCTSCEILKMEVARLQIENDRLLDRLLNPIKPAEPEPTDLKEFKPIRPNAMAWSTRQRMLEEESRAKAKLLKENGATGREDIQELEKELGVTDAK